MSYTENVHLDLPGLFIRVVHWRVYSLRKTTTTKAWSLVTTNTLLIYDYISPLHLGDPLIQG